ncbi:MAG: hypothetical protein MUC29_05470, partial [Pyrinomonadaceae bacterium]|nr:hypothetical protein [Pyrinomonadaceae bacterium]
MIKDGLTFSDENSTDFVVFNYYTFREIIIGILIKYAKKSESDARLAVGYFHSMLKLKDLNYRIRRVIREQKLKNETKLAKWDTQSYYALAESTERNQRKLMKILSEFDESMDLNVGVLIQDFSCEGLRSSVDHYDECCATFPALDSMFPFGGREGTDSTSAGEEYPANWTKPNSKISFDPDKIGIPLEERARKLGKYVRKMAIA